MQSLLLQAPAQVQAPRQAVVPPRCPFVCASQQAQQRCRLSLPQALQSVLLQQAQQELQLLHYLVELELRQRQMMLLRHCLQQLQQRCRAADAWPSQLRIGAAVAASAHCRTLLMLKPTMTLQEQQKQPKNQQRKTQTQQAQAQALRMRPAAPAQPLQKEQTKRQQRPELRLRERRMAGQLS